MNLFHHYEAPDPADRMCPVCDSQGSYPVTTRVLFVFKRTTLVPCEICEGTGIRPEGIKGLALALQQFGELMRPSMQALIDARNKYFEDERNRGQ